LGKVIVSKSMSLDGFVAGPNVSVESPMGEGGLRLHDWFLNAPAGSANAEMMRESSAAIGAVILGKRTFDIGVGLWEDTPFPVPSFVLTHEPRADRIEKSGTFVFVTDGIASALAKAQAAAGGRNIVLMGAETSNQYLKAGVVDEIHVTVVPVLLGRGARLFDDIGTEPVELVYTMAQESGGVTHLRLQVVR
jgi:dihydrofolate reductase